MGSAKSQKINFGRGQKVFHTTDVPAEAMQAKRAVQKSKQSNILGVEQQPWHASTITDQKVQRDDPDLKRQLLKVRAGLFDEKIIKPPRNHNDETIADLQRHVVGMTGKGPVGKISSKWFNAISERGLAAHPHMDAWPDWNNSTACHTKDDTKQAALRFHEREQRRLRMMSGTGVLGSDAYIDPETHITNVQERIRERKVAFHDLKQQFKRELLVEFPQASEERLQAMAQRLLSEKLLVDEKMARFPVHNERFRPNLALTAKDQRYREYFHPGAWTWLESEGCEGYSCCMNFARDSRGCEHRVVNPGAWLTMGYEHNSA